MRLKIGFFEFTNNIIARAEFRHQRFIINNSRSGTGWIVLALLLLAPAALMSLTLFVIGSVSAWSAIDQMLNSGSAIIRVFSQIGAVAFITMNIALYLVVILVTMGLSASSITREKENKTWSVLVLTNITARQLVWGKWWASLQAMWGDHLMLALMRLGIAGWTIVFYHDHLPDGYFGLPPGATHVATLTAVIVAFTVIDAAFTAAMGIAVPLSDLSGAVIVAIVIGVRAVAIGILMWFAFQVKDALIGNQPYFLIAGMGLLVFVLITWFTLRVAQWVAVRGQLSPP